LKNRKIYFKNSTLLEKIELRIVNYSYLTIMSYNEGKIYKITSKQTDKIYIGSTKEALELRFRMHKRDYRAYLKSNKSGCSSIELLKHGDCKIELIELFPCDSRLELCRREGDIQLENRSIIINHNIAGRTQEEYYAENKDKIDEYKAQWRSDHKEYNAEYGAQYRLNNGDYFVKYMAQHYLDNKEKITALVQCECGSIVQHCGKAHHNKSKKHISFISA